jgi:Zinc finger C-x8-C-x5-C-x3-H type (and similar)
MDLVYFRGLKIKMANKKYKLFKVTNGEKQAPCAFFSSHGGCKNGDNCRFVHERSVVIPRQDEEANLLDLVRSNSLISSESEDEHQISEKKKDEELEKFEKRLGKSKAVSRLMNTPCSYFLKGECKSGEKCRFLHEQILSTTNSRVPLKISNVSEVFNQEGSSKESISKAKKRGIKRRNDGDIFAASRCSCEILKVKKKDSSSSYDGRISDDPVKGETSTKQHTENKVMASNSHSQKFCREAQKWQVAIDKTRENPRYLSLYNFNKLKKSIGRHHTKHSTKWITAKPFGNWCRKNPKVIAIACEMFKTQNTSTNEEHRKSLCRISIVNVENPEDILLDTLVKPEWPIGQCNSSSRKHLDHVPFTIEHAQHFLSALCSQVTVIVGHGVYDHLAAVRMDHQCVIDLSLIADSNRSFQQIVKDFLNVEISRNCSTLEAATASIQCLDVWLGRQK